MKPDFPRAFGTAGSDRAGWNGSARRRAVGLAALLTGAAVVGLCWQSFSGRAAGRPRASAPPGGAASAVSTQAAPSFTASPEAAGRSGGGSAPKLLRGSGPVEAVPSGLAGLLARPVTDEPGVVNECVRALKALRGTRFSEEDLNAAFALLGDRAAAEKMGKESYLWLVDELLTALRLQEPARQDLAGRLSGMAEDPGCDPMVRDYVMQHLGHLWEMSGPGSTLAKALWAGTDAPDATSPGAALLALQKGYLRDGNQEMLGQVYAKARQMAGNPGIPLATRVNALAIAGESGSAEARRLASDLLRADTTPLILRKVAENILAKAR